MSARAPVVIRQPLLIRIYIAVFGVVWLSFVGTFAIASLSFVAIVPFAMFAFGAVFITRMFRVAVVADDNGILVRNNFRTRRYAWSEVEGFRAGPSARGLPFVKAIYVLLRDHSVLELDVTVRLWMWPGAADKLAAYTAELQRFVG